MSSSKEVGKVIARVIGLSDTYICIRMSYTYVHVIDLAVGIVMGIPFVVDCGCGHCILFQPLEY